MRGFRALQTVGSGAKMPAPPRMRGSPVGVPMSNVLLLDASGRGGCVVRVGWVAVLNGRSRLQGGVPPHCEDATLRGLALLLVVRVDERADVSHVPSVSARRSSSGSGDCPHVRSFRLAEWDADEAGRSAQLSALVLQLHRPIPRYRRR